MIYTVDQLIEDFRSDVWDRAVADGDDTPRDTLWSDTDVLRYINSACAQLASDTLALRRRFEIAVEAGQALVRFPLDEILDELVVSFAIPGLGRRRALRQFDIDEGVRRDDYGSRVYVQPDLEAAGTPSHYTRDYDNTNLRLWPVPYLPGVLHAQAIVMPQPLHCGMPLPFSARKDLDLLLMWMKHLAYAKHDADVLDLERSKSFERDYHTYVALRRTEIDRLRRDHAIVKPS